MLNPLIGLPNLFLFLGKLASESLFFREARDGLHFEVSYGQEGRKSCEYAILVVDHDTWPLR